jgi:hypothetical protein
MALVGHQLARALALALGVPATQEPAVVQEETQQIEVGAAEMVGLPRDWGCKRQRGMFASGLWLGVDAWLGS